MIGESGFTAQTNSADGEDVVADDLQVGALLDGGDLPADRPRHRRCRRACCGGRCRRRRGDDAGDVGALLLEEALRHRDANGMPLAATPKLPTAICSARAAPANARPARAPANISPLGNDQRCTIVIAFLSPCWLPFGAYCCCKPGNELARAQCGASWARSALRARPSAN